MDGLRVGATVASQHHFLLALDLIASRAANRWPEAALLGSVARGMADDRSDIELGFWVEVLPSQDERAAWLASIGGTEWRLDDRAVPCDATWALFRFRGVWVEAAWYTPAFHDQELTTILRGEVTDGDRLHLPGALADAVVLRSVGILTGWQVRLARYPDVLAARLIADAVGAWRFPGHLTGRWTEARRGHRHTVLEECVRDLHRVWRILFAINGAWEMDWKWLAPAMGNLAIRPDDLVRRIEEIFQTAPLEEAVRRCLELARDTLALVPPPHDVTAAASVIGASLSQEAG